MLLLLLIIYRYEALWAPGPSSCSHPESRHPDSRIQTAMRGLTQGSRTLRLPPWSCHGQQNPLTQLSF